MFLTIEEGIRDVDHADDKEEVEGLAGKVLPEVRVVVVQDGAEEGGILRRGKHIIIIIIQC